MSDRLQFIDPRCAEATLQGPQGKRTISELDVQIANYGSYPTRNRCRIREEGPGDERNR
jgi:hypothetical protein